MNSEKIQNAVETEPIFLTKIKKIIAESPEKIRDEFERSDNVWIDCFNTRMVLVAGYWHMFKTSNEYDVQKYAVVESKLEKLQSVFGPLHTQYRSREADPSDEIKSELFKLLNIFE
jgi:hypothetical protein